mmetsp:Transcript_28927/g.73070  ORF Transcript_28927/g.73070 Transcript_28927/m.73070 type:complete len:201 (+) Transcript_28927:170-772(+)
MHCSDAGSGDDALIERSLLQVRLHGHVLARSWRPQLLRVHEAVLDSQAGDQGGLDLADELDVRGAELRLHLLLDGLLLLLCQGLCRLHPHGHDVLCLIERAHVLLDNGLQGLQALLLRQESHKLWQDGGLKRLHELHHSGGLTNQTHRRVVHDELQLVQEGSVLEQGLDLHDILRNRHTLPLAGRSRRQRVRVCDHWPAR